MSTVRFNHTNSDGAQTLSVFITKDDGEQVNRVVSTASPSFPRLAGYFLENIDTPPEDLDAEYVHTLVDPTVAIGRRLQAEFGDRVTFDLHHFYVDGVREDTRLGTHIKQKVLSGDTEWERLVRFLVRLDDNPSSRAKNAVWAWVEKHGVSITEDGRIVGYKGLVNGDDAVTGERNIPVSFHSGPNNFIDGTLYGETGVDYQVPHRVGTTISKRRADVDDNNRLACSTGLHVGAYSYAKTFGENRADGARYSTMGRMADSLPNSTFALVAFAPEDVVSVPEDNTADWKIRVSRYEVLEFLSEVSDVLKDTASYDKPQEVEVPVKTSAPFIPPGEPKPQPTPQPVVEPPLSEEIVDEEEPEPEEEQAEIDPSTLVGAQQGRYTALIENGVSQEEAFEDAQDWPEFETVQLGDLVLKAPNNDKPSLQEWADLNQVLADDLANGDLGHKAVGRKYAGITTESSVRRYRKTHDIRVSLGSRVRDAVS